MSMTKTLLIYGHILNLYWYKFIYSKPENVFSLNNVRLKIMVFQNKFYLYNQNLVIWKKNNMNFMNMPEKD
jgi:hypothetical protein